MLQLQFKGLSKFYLRKTERAAASASTLHAPPCRLTGSMFGCVIIPIMQNVNKILGTLSTFFFFFCYNLLLRPLHQSVAMSGAWAKSLVCVMVTRSWLWLSGNVRQASKFPLPASTPPRLATCETTLELLSGQSKRCTRSLGMCLHWMPGLHADPLLIFCW